MQRAIRALCFFAVIIALVRTVDGVNAGSIVHLTGTMVTTVPNNGQYIRRGLGNQPFNMTFDTDGRYLLKILTCNWTGLGQEEVFLCYDGNITTFYFQPNTNINLKSITGMPVADGSALTVRADKIPLVLANPRDGWPLLWYLYTVGKNWGDTNFVYTLPNITEPLRTLKMLGYRHVTEGLSKDGIFPERVEIIRDVALDKPIEEEIKLEIIDYPNTTAEYKVCQSDYTYRLEIPNDFKRVLITPTAWANFNNVKIPIAANMKIHDPISKSGPVLVYSLVVESIGSGDEDFQFSIPVTPPVAVIDQRFRSRSNNVAINFLSYRLTNRPVVLPSLTDAKFLEAIFHKSEYSKMRSYGWLSNMGSLLVAFGAFLLLAAPVAIAWNYRKRSI